MITLEKPHVKYKESFLDFIRECQAIQNAPQTPANEWWQSESKRDIAKLDAHFEDFVNDRLDTKKRFVGTILGKRICAILDNLARKTER